MRRLRSTSWAREAAFAAAALAISLAVLPPLVAAVAAQSGQAMFWPALQALYTYFFRYTLAGAFVIGVLTVSVRLTVRLVRRSRVRDGSHR